MTCSCERIRGPGIDHRRRLGGVVALHTLSDKPASLEAAPGLLMAGSWGRRETGRPHGPTLRSPSHGLDSRTARIPTDSPLAGAEGRRGYWSKSSSGMGSSSAGSNPAAQMVTERQRGALSAHRSEAEVIQEPARSRPGGTAGRPRRIPRSRNAGALGVGLVGKGEVGFEVLLDAVVEGCGLRAPPPVGLGVAVDPGD